MGAFSANLFTLEPLRKDNLEKVDEVSWRFKLFRSRRSHFKHSALLATAVQIKDTPTDSQSIKRTLRLYRGKKLAHFKIV